VGSGGRRRFDVVGSGGRRRFDDAGFGWSEARPSAPRWAPSVDRPSGADAQVLRFVARRVLSILGVRVRRENSLRLRASAALR